MSGRIDAQLVIDHVLEGTPILTPVSVRPFEAARMTVR